MRAARDQSAAVPASRKRTAAPSRSAAAIRGAKSPEVGIGREHAACELAKFAVFGFGLAGEQPTAGSATPRTDLVSKEFVAAGAPIDAVAAGGEIERLLFEETLIIYAYFHDTLFASQKNITGVDAAPTGQLLLWNAVKT